MRFEVFDGTRSVASVALDAAGALTLALHDPAERDYLLGYFGGASGDGEEREVTLRGDWTPLAFEIACLALGRERGFAVVPRTSGHMTEE